MDLTTYAKTVFGDAPTAPCPFTEAELAELEKTKEMVVYVPPNLTVKDLAARVGVIANFDFANERFIRNVMMNEGHWFVTSSEKTPELMYCSGQHAKRIYEDEGLHGMDLRRYLAFCATFKWKYDTLPDEIYWTFLHSGSYDRSGISIVGFDSHGILNHHGWMKNFKAKFVGSRYACLAPRIEITPETAKLPRAYRGQKARAGQEADID